GRYLLDLRRLLLLVREDVRGEVQRVPGPGALLDHVHRREPDLLPTALPGPAGHAASLRRLSGSLHLLKLRVLGGLRHHHRRRRRLPGDAAESAIRRRKAEANPWGEGATTLEWT